MMQSCDNQNTNAPCLDHTFICNIIIKGKRLPIMPVSQLVVIMTLIKIIPFPRQVMRCSTLQIKEFKVATQCRYLQNMDAAMLDLGYMAFTGGYDNEAGGKVIKEGFCELKSRELDLHISKQ